MIQYPKNVVRIMRPQIQRAFDAALHHFHRRHDGRGFGPAKMWIKEARKIDTASEYSKALSLVRGAK